MTIPSYGLAQAEVESERVAPSGTVIEEVIVRVTKRAESVQDVAGSVAALAETMVRDFQITDANALASSIPNVVSKTPGKISIRGISAAGFQGSNAPQPVAQHENGYFVAEVGLEYPYYDIGSIEVLRGPSGTVFGRNATGGAIDVRWAEPDPEAWHGSVEYRVRANEFDRWGELLRGYLNAPLLGNFLTLRAAFADDKPEPQYDNLLEPDRRDPGTDVRRWHRLYLLSDLHEDFTVRLRYIKRQSEQLQFNSSNHFVRTSGIHQDFGAMSLPPDDNRLIRSNLLRDTKLSAFAPYEKMGDGRSRRTDGDISWQLHDMPLLGDIELFLLAGKYNTDNANLTEADGTEVAILDTINAFERRQQSGEFRVTSTGGGAFSWLVGYFWAEFDMDVEVFIDAAVKVRGNTLGLDLTGTGLEEEGIIAVIEGISPQSTRNRASAVFFSIELDLGPLWGNAPDITLFGGLRANEDETRFFGTQVIDVVGIRPTGAPPSATVPTGRIPLGAGDFGGDTDFSRTTGEIGVRWHYSDQGMTYLKVASGYKAGKLQQVPSGNVGLVEPELLDAIEIGAKQRLLGGGMVLNAAMFLYDYTDLQVTQLIQNLPIVENAATATVIGFESDLQYAPVADLMIRASLGLLKATFDEFCSQDPFDPVFDPDPGCSDAKPKDLSDNHLADAPEVSATLMLQYELPLGDGGRFGSVLASLKSSYRDNSFRRPHNRAEVDAIEAYTISDLRLLWRSPRARFEAELFVENLEDENQLWLTGVTLGTPGVYALLDHVPGRRYGAALRYTL